jgi:hypothetical protein
VPLALAISTDITTQNLDAVPRGTAQTKLFAKKHQIGSPLSLTFILNDRGGTSFAPVIPIRIFAFVLDDRVAPVVGNTVRVLGRNRSHTFLLTQ